MEEDHTTWSKVCCSTTFVNTPSFLCLVSAVKNAFFLVPTANPLSQAFSFQVIGSNINHLWLQKAFSLMLLHFYFADLTMNDVKKR